MRVRSAPHTIPKGHGEDSRALVSFILLAFIRFFVKYTDRQYWKRILLYRASVSFNFAWFYKVSAIQYSNGQYLDDLDGSPIFLILACFHKVFLQIH